MFEERRVLRVGLRFGLRELEGAGALALSSYRKARLKNALLWYSKAA